MEATLSMGERVVSVKMPKSLVRELRVLAEQQHYLDLSEQLRSIVRSQCLRYSAGFGFADIRQAVQQEMKTANTQLRKEQLLQELSRLLEGPQ